MASLPAVRASHGERDRLAWGAAQELADPRSPDALDRDAVDRNHPVARNYPRGPRFAAEGVPNSGGVKVRRYSEGRPERGPLLEQNPPRRRRGGNRQYQCDKPNGDIGAGAPYAAEPAEPVVRSRLEHAPPLCRS